MFESSGLSAASINTITDWAANRVQFDPISIVVSAVINEFLPDLETKEGMIASSIASVALAAFQGVAGIIGPFALILSWVVGKIFDSLFVEFPQAWSSVGFNSQTGKFEIVKSWEDDGGNPEIGQKLASAYIDGMNKFLDTVKSNSNDFDTLVRTFGHYEEKIGNDGFGRYNMSEFHKVMADAYVEDVTESRANDGQMTALRAIEYPTLGGNFAEDAWLYVLNEMFETKSVSKAYEKFDSDFFANGWTFEALYGARYNNDEIGFYRFIKKNLGLTPHLDKSGKITDAELQQYIKKNNITTFREFLQPYLDGTYAPLVKDNYGTPKKFYETLPLGYLSYSINVNHSTWKTLEDLMGQGPGFVLSPTQKYDLIQSRLQIADDYHIYLENQDAIDTMILLNPKSAFAAGWVATLASAKEMGLDEPYYLNGDSFGNNFFTAAGNDFVMGAAGNDDIRTYGGDDILAGGTGNDSLSGGSGNDRLYGDEGNDTLIAGSGSDVLYGGVGNDVIMLGTGGTEKAPKLAKGEGGNDRYVIAAGLGYANIGFEGDAQGTQDIIEFQSYKLSDLTITLETYPSSNRVSAIFKAGDMFLRVADVNAIEQFKFADGKVLTKLPANLPTVAASLDDLTFMEIPEKPTDFYGTDDIVYINPVQATTPDPTEYLGETHEILNGSYANDLLSGFEGNDRLNGGAGNDILHGDTTVK